MAAHAGKGDNSGRRATAQAEPVRTMVTSRQAAGAQLYQSKKVLDLADRPPPRSPHHVYLL